ncbi:MAG: M1 family metallopeptidase [Vulcanimicrobiota bacterium]
MKAICKVLFLFVWCCQFALAIDDPHSYSEPEKARVTHLNLDLEVDFEQRRLAGIATWDFERLSGDRIVFDVRHMQIRSVKARGKLLPFELGPTDELLGQPLTVLLPEGVEQVSIAYTTRPEAAALQWLDPVQTAGKEKPFLFTQSQAILARTWIPCQDTPGVRFTYEARLKVPGDLLALMSATNPTGLNPEGVYSFKMPQAISSYLMAMAVGDLRFQSLGKVTGIYAEPSLLEKAAYEFADTEKMVTAVEGMFGPYRWGRYDMLVLPPSFPFGGMENPRLTFLTPTVIAGDRSLTSLIAHELAHSWSGNLVTNETWNDFWLNEGFTVYLERRIMEELYGESYATMLAQLGYGDLTYTLNEIAPEDSKLKLDLKGRDPDEGLTDVAYEKGYLFLTALEQQVGREKFDPFLRRYFDDNAFGTLNTEEFLQRVERELGSDLGVETWVYSAGLPEGFKAPRSERFQQVDHQRLSFFSGGKTAEQLKTDQWTSHEWIHFLRGFPQSISPTEMAELDRVFHFSQSGNSEILAQWLVNAIHADYQPAYPALEQFLITVGRRKFLTPLYKELAKTPEGLKRARSIYAQARPNYHSVSVGTIDEIVEWESRPRD